MKSKLFVYCNDCGGFDKEIKSKKDLYKFCPMCGKKLKGVKIPLNQYLKCKNEIKSIGVNMWFGIETIFSE